MIDITSDTHGAYDASPYRRTGERVPVLCGKAVPL